MRLIKNIYRACAAALVASVIFGCEQDNLVKPHALLTESSLTFDAINAEPQLLRIASDEDWTIEAPDWITVDPMSGSQTVDVTVSVADNGTASALKAPRQAAIMITTSRGYSVETVIYQKGDTYLGINEYTVTDVAELADDSKAKVIGGQVVAVAANGFVVSDGTTNLYVASDAEVAVGDELYFNGEKSSANGLPVFKGDEVEIRSSKEVKYPSAIDITSSIDTYTSDKIALVSVSGTLVGTNLRNIPGSPSKGVAAYQPHESIGLAEMNVHKVVLTGYYVGMAGGSLNIIVSSVKDEGEDEAIGVDFPFHDDFSWLEPYIAAANKALGSAKQISDCVGNTIVSADGAANIYTTLVTGNIPVLEKLRELGYTDLNPEMQTIYLQDQYFKFGATDKQSGLILPLMRMEGEQDIVVSFKWCCHLSGALNVDDVKLVVAIDGPGTVVTASGSSDAKVSDDIASTQGKGEMFWMDASVTITGATKATFITIRPNPIGTSENKVTGVHRYYLDDISVVSTADAVPATISVSGVENDVIAFEGTPDGPASFDVTSDRDYTISTGAKWLSLDVTEGAAYQEQTVTVTCEPSELNTLRQGTIIVKSGTSTYTIPVVQSAAGQELAPFISLKSGNYITVLGEGDAFVATVQANTDYEVEILDEWITEVEMPATKALVEYTDHKFAVAVNVTGSPRTGRIRFYNKDLNIETVLNVTQDNFEPKMSITLPSQVCFIPASGMTVPVQIESNVDFTISSNVLTLPVSGAPSGSYDMEFTVPANTGLSRDVTVTMENEYYSHTYTFKIEQHGTDVIFADDFSWLKPIVDAVNPDGSGNYDTVGSKDLSAIAPNIYGTAAMKAAFVPICNQMGYYIPGKDDGANDVLYLQDCYLKLGKTGSSSQTSLTLPSVDPAGKDMTVSFDWARMVQGSGTVDNYTLTLMIEGNGTFENGTKYSDELSTPQAKGEIFWTNFSVKVSGADANTKITFVPTDLVNKSTGKIDYKKTGGKRAFYDNIVVKVN
ncbi:MAG: hypothetical protein K2H95_00415 [Bacteroidales bacterium]|nr:hypothetical protein [Bacteroidales bacterium]